MNRHMMGNTGKIRSGQEKILAPCSTMGNEPVATLPAEKRKQQEIASVVSAARI